MPHYYHSDFQKQDNTMGREQKDAIELIASLQDSITEHLWKMFAYHNAKQQDMNESLAILNKHISKLSKFKIPKHGDTPNFGYEELYNKYYIEPFGADADLVALINEWRRKGYPLIYVHDRSKLEKLVVKFINCVLNLNLFIVMEDELN